MTIRKIPITFECNCPRTGSHKCYMHKKKILGKDSNKTESTMYEVEINGEKYLSRKKISNL